MHMSLKPVGGYRSGAKSALKTVNGKLVSKKSKTGKSECSAAVSQWRTNGMNPQVAAILGKCRAAARALGGAAKARAAGSEGKAQHLEHRVASGAPVTVKDRMAKAKSLMADRAAKAQAPAASAPARPAPRVITLRSRGTPLRKAHAYAVEEMHRQAHYSETRGGKSEAQVAIDRGHYQRAKRSLQAVRKEIARSGEPTPKVAPASHTIRPNLKAAPAKASPKAAGRGTPERLARAKDLLRERAGARNSAETSKLYTFGHAGKAAEGLDREIARAKAHATRAARKTPEPSMMSATSDHIPPHRRPAVLEHAQKILRREQKAKDRAAAPAHSRRGTPAERSERLANYRLASRNTVRALARPPHRSIVGRAAESALPSRIERTRETVARLKDDARKGTATRSDLSQLPGLRASLHVLRSHEAATRGPAPKPKAPASPPAARPARSSEARVAGAAKAVEKIHQIAMKRGYDFAPERTARAVSHALGARHSGAKVSAAEASEVARRARVHFGASPLSHRKAVEAVTGKVHTSQQYADRAREIAGDAYGKIVGAKAAAAPKAAARPDPFARVRRITAKVEKRTVQAEVAKRKLIHDEAGKVRALEPSDRPAVARLNRTIERGGKHLGKARDALARLAKGSRPKAEARPAGSATMGSMNGKPDLKAVAAANRPKTLAERLDRLDRRKAKERVVGGRITDSATERHNRLVRVARSAPIEAASERQESFARDTRARKAIEAAIAANDYLRGARQAAKAGHVAAEPIVVLKKLRDLRRKARAVARTRSAREVLG